MDVEPTGRGLYGTDGPLSTRICILWAAKLSPIHRNLSFNVLREICDYIGDVQMLPCAQGKSLRFFNFDTKQWNNPQRLSTKIPFDQYTRYTLLGDNRVFCCGSESNIYTDKPRAANILARDGAVERLKDMINPHKYAGIVFVANRNSIYVFGGGNLEAGIFYAGNGEAARIVYAGNVEAVCIIYAGNVEAGIIYAVSEMLPIQPNTTWQQLPNMNHVRSHFNPVWFMNLLYLCGGWTTAIDVFSPGAGTMRALEVSLPEKSACIAYVTDNRLVVLSVTKRSTFRFGDNGNLVQEGSTAKGESFSLWSLATPVLLGNLVYLVQDIICVRLEAATGRGLDNYNE